MSRGKRTGRKGIRKLERKKTQTSQPIPVSKLGCQIVEYFKLLDSAPTMLMCQVRDDFVGSQGAR